MESKVSKKGSENSQALFVQEKKARRKGPSKNKESTSKLGNILSNVKCFICHKHKQHALQCPDKKAKRQSSRSRHSITQYGADVVIYDKKHKYILE